MTVEAFAVPGLPEVRRGDDLAQLVATALSEHGLHLRDDDVVVVASKVVAKAEGRTVAATGRAAAIDAQTVRLVAERTLPDGRTTRVVQSRSGPVLAAAGVDASDVAAGTVLLLPVDADAAARSLRNRLGRLLGVRPAVAVSDTTGRPWREGVADFVLGAAGLVVLDDVRGRPDRSGRPMEVTVRAIGDEVCSLADLVRGKATGLPVAVVRGLGAYVTTDDGPGAAPAVRVGPTDWFAYGHVEAVRAALGVPEGSVPSPPIDPVAETLADKVSRAVAVALAARSDGVSVVVDDAVLHVDGAPFWAGGVVERLRAALWAEGLVSDVDCVGTAVHIRVMSVVR